MDRFLGRAVKRGEIIPAEDMAKLSPQATRGLIDGQYISMAGMAPNSAATSPGMETHLRARVDNLEARVKKLEAANADLLARIEKLLPGAAEEPASTDAEKPVPPMRRARGAKG
jgi:hypothetical protein